MRIGTGTLAALAAVTLIAVTACTPKDEHVAAEESYSAFCTGGADEISPRVHALCADLPGQLQTAFLAEPWDLIAETSLAAADACTTPVTMETTPPCQALERHIDQLSPLAFSLALPPTERLSASDAGQLYDEACGGGQADASPDSQQGCQSAANALGLIRGPGLSGADLASGLTDFSLSMIGAARAVAETCWPAGAPQPLGTDACRAVHWTWNGADTSRCLPDHTVLQNRLLSERSQAEAAMRYMRQPAICFQ